MAEPVPSKFQGTSPVDFPIVDLSNPNEDLVARAVVKASETWGMFQVVNHGIPTELMRRLKELGTEFFELPEKEKEAVARPADSTDLEGYTTDYKKDGEGRKTWADHLFHRIWPPSRINYRFWPKNSPDYREVNEEYAKEIKKLSEKIMGWLSEGLGLHRDALKEGLGGEKVEYLMKIIFYPPCPKLELLYGAPHHTDLNGITFLIADEVDGLQAFQDNKWVDVKYDDSGIVVIIADQIKRMSNGRYKSGEHRATIDTVRTRLSWPVFAEPNLDHVVGPLPELVIDDAPKFKPYVYREYKFLKMNKLPLE
ncbi:unnamed protein product [Brassica oleracea var. botrytis]|uniref:Fe2OG dioxygenase domain-containing protein n=2 Tax=Brassica TaxID=3705 RepID=A0A0D3AYJ7_BRAOL|nr:PREDICTED: flavonol synthase 3-like [Brassica oleracea var. oleracea]CAF1921696.1 unnamed protein product [Brassica napus]CDY39860.1 BnaC02g42580D [Brassica napus]